MNSDSIHGSLDKYLLIPLLTVPSVGREVLFLTFFSSVSPPSCSDTLNSSFVSTSHRHSMQSVTPFISIFLHIWYNLPTACSHQPCILERGSFMKNKLYDRFTKMAIKSLTQLQNVKTIDDLTIEGYPPKEVREFLYQCYEMGYIKLTDAYRDAYLAPHFEHSLCHRLTISGYEFLNNLHASNAAKNARFAKMSSIAAIGVSLLSVISNIVLVYLSIK